MKTNEQRYTAREWLERTLPEGGEWRVNQHRNDNVYWHPNKSKDGICFSPYGVVRFVCVPQNSIAYDHHTEAARSTAIDLMVAAIEGEQAIIPKQISGSSDEVAKEPDPYAHLPHGGWWVATNQRLFHWPNNSDLGQRFLLDGRPHMDEGDNTCCPWTASATYVHSKPRLTREQVVAIIEQRRAKEADNDGSPRAYEPVIIGPDQDSRVFEVHRAPTISTDSPLFRLVEAMVKSAAGKAHADAPHDVVKYARKLLAEMEVRE